MRLLLDTCAFLWLTQEPHRLSPAARSAVDDEQSELLFSHASIWEIFLKHQAGKMKLPAKPDRWIREHLGAWMTTDLPIDLASLNETLRLPELHRDPFDRLLIAQARVHELALLTPDPWIRKYRVKCIW